MARKFVAISPVFSANATKTWLRFVGKWNITTFKTLFLREAMKSSVIPSAILLITIFGLASGFDQPNIIIMMADDMGYSDTQPFGSEISTPNLQSLADSGLRMTNFYNTARCSTSRASLLSGQYSHNVGIGWLPSSNHNNQNGGTMPGYSGWFAGLDPQAPDNVPTLPEVLKLAGYDTYMTGKWHLTRTNTINGGPNGSWPVERGFDKFYGTMEGAKDYFEPTWLVDSDTPNTFENVNNLTCRLFLYERDIGPSGSVCTRRGC